MLSYGISTFRDANKEGKMSTEAMVKAIKAGQPTPISMADIAAGHLASFAAVESLQKNAPVAVDMDAFWRDVQATEETTLAEDPSA